MIEVLTAAKEGKAIQERNGVDWKEFSVADRLRHCEVRVKPEPRRFWIVAGPHEVINAYHHEPTGLREVDEAIQVVEVSK